MNSQPNKKYSPLGLAIAVLLATPVTAQSATVLWTGAASPNYNWSAATLDLYGTNWGPYVGIRPQDGDSLQFNGNALRANALSSTTNNNDYLGYIGGLEFLDNTEFTLNGNALVSNGNITNYGVGTQTVNLPISLGADQIWDGGLETPFDSRVGKMYVNNFAGLGDYALTLQRNVLLSTDNQNLIIGNQGQGGVSVLNNSRVHNAQGVLGAKTGSVGTATVDGAESVWINSKDLVVGFAGNGNLNIQNGGQTYNQFGLIAWELGSSGKVSVDGAGSTWSNNKDLYVGRYGQAELTISNGGAVTNENAYLGYYVESSGAVTVDGEGSRWTNSGTLNIGYLGNGDLTIKNGGQVASNSGLIGYIPSSSGRVTIKGADSAWTVDQNLTVGYGGSGTVELSGGGQLNVGGLLDINSGSVNLYGGILSAGTAHRDLAGQFFWGHGLVNLGTVTIGESGGLFDNDLLVDADKFLNVEGNAGLLDNAYVSVTNNGWFNVENNLSNQGVLNIGSGGEVSASRLSNNGVIVNRGLLTASELSNQSNIQLAGGGQIFSHNLKLEGGSIGGAALLMDGINVLKGKGSVTSSIVGGSAANTIQASGGNLDLGNSNSIDGFDFGGKLDVGANQVNLLDKDKANLGVSTSLADGGKLSTVNGADLGTGETLNYTGNASILGNFTNNGEASGSGGVLTFLNDVNGAGGFNGDVAFHGDYNPGNSPAAIDFHGGDISFNPTSVLTMEIFGNTPGSQYDQLLNIDHFDFNGTLALVFGGSFTPTAGSSFNLFDFASFSGSFAPGHITVTGLDRALLDFSKLASQGSLGVTAVPLPASVWFFGSSLLYLLRIAKGRK